MIPWKKRISTWVNLVSMMCAAAMAFIPSLGFTETATAYIMLMFSVFITFAQWWKQQDKTEPVKDTEEEPWN